MISLKNARRAGVPLVVVETADQAQAMADIVKNLNGVVEKTPLLCWDIVRALRPINTAGEMAIPHIDKNGEGAVATANPAECLSLLANAPDDSVVFMLNFHRFIGDSAVAQGVWNLRDIWKSTRCTLVMMCPSMEIPSELTQDVVVLSDTLPVGDDLQQIVNSICDDAGVAKPKDSKQIIDALLGLSAFAAEQVLAMSVTKQGIDQSSLWDRKKKMIEQTKGLAIHKSGDTFADLGGLDNAKTILGQVLKGKCDIRAIVFIDEIDKGLAASRSDTSGTTQDQLKVLLTYMQDEQIPGMTLVGPPGCLAGDSVLGINRRGKGFKVTIKDFVHSFNGGSRGGHKWDRRMTTMVQRESADGVVRLARVVGAWESGVKTTYEVTTDFGRKIRATDEHPFMTNRGWRRLDQLVVGDDVHVECGRSNKGRAPKKDYGSTGTKFHPRQRKANGGFRCPTHRLAAEAELNGMSFQDFIHALRSDPGLSGQFRYLTPEQVVHHIDGDHTNNHPLNLEITNNVNHPKGHDCSGNVLLQVGTEKVVSVKKFGKEMTYDIEVADDPHNFIANGFVVHNTGKTAISKAAANEFNLPMITLDLGAMKGSLVGESERQLRGAIKVIHAVSGGKALFIGACNRTDQLPPELRRRFNFVAMFVDLPDKSEKAELWKIWKAKYGLEKAKHSDVDDTGWTGAEIRNACLKAWAMESTIAEAAKSVVPVSVSAADEISNLRKNASGRYISASHEGLYRYSEMAKETGGKAARKIEVK